jgi:hypothetical protein
LAGDKAGIPHRPIGPCTLEAMFFLFEIFYGKKKTFTNAPGGLGTRFFGEMPNWQKLTNC